VVDLQKLSSVALVHKIHVVANNVPGKRGTPAVEIHIVEISHRAIHFNCHQFLPTKTNGVLAIVSARIECRVGGINCYIALQLKCIIGETVHAL